MSVRIAFLGAGAVGTPAALLAATALKDAEITVIDAGTRPPGSRTFVLLCGVCDMLQDNGVWEHIEGNAHRIDSVKGDFEGCFGRLSLSGDDCQSESVGYSMAEGGLLDSLRAPLERMSNVEMIMDASVTSISIDGEVRWKTPDDSENSSRFDLVCVAGLPEAILAKSGFAFSTKEYQHLAVVSTFTCDNPSHLAHERFFTHGASTLVPRKDGYGHILIASSDSISKQANMTPADYASWLVNKGWLPDEDRLKIVAMGSYAPRMRLARNPGIGRIALLGASACSIHPMGAQELNLGICDAVELSDLLSRSQAGDLATVAGKFAELRAPVRRKIARATDLAAMVATTPMPGKLCLGGLAATAIDICPPARQALLGAMVLP